MAIPQAKSDFPSADADTQAAILSIPAYVEAASLVFVAVPPATHEDRKELCSFTSSASRRTACHLCLGPSDAFRSRTPKVLALGEGSPASSSR